MPIETIEGIPGLGKPIKWRVGTKMPINVYEGDRPVCQCHTAIDAKRIVAAMNSYATSEALKKLAWTTAGVLDQIRSAGPTEMISAVFDGRELKLAEDAVKEAEKLLRES